MQATRRAYLARVSIVVTGALAGCGANTTDETDGDADAPTRSSASGGETNTSGGGGPVPPTAEVRPHLGHSVETLAEHATNGGVPKDGIPSIDDPVFAGPDDVDVDPGDPVFGLVRNGEARAYRQDVLVYHEVVNDDVGGEPVAITYCPLTGTVQGFERGPVTFGVSGDLVNSNLIMYDRATDSRWPQIGKTAVEGPLTGEVLREFGLVWTTWDRWRSAHPESDVLTEDTGYVRRYGEDPYGTYNPRTRYYEEDGLLFSPIVRDDRTGPKTVVLGARTAAGAIAFHKQRLLDENLLSGPIGDVAHVAVADQALRTGYVYANPDGRSVTATGDGYDLGGQTYPPDGLPLERVVAFDAMWFAWYGYYPETTYVA